MGRKVLEEHTGNDAIVAEISFSGEKKKITRDQIRGVIMVEDQNHAFRGQKCAAEYHGEATNLGYAIISDFSANMLLRHCKTS
jgi:hypothetical protein